MSGPSQDELVEYMIYNTKMQYVFALNSGDNEMLLVQGTIYIVKLLVLRQICWFRTAGQAAFSNTACDLLILYEHDRLS